MNHGKWKNGQRSACDQTRVTFMSTHIQVNVYTMWLLYSTRVVLLGAKFGAETTGTEGETFQSQQSPSSVVAC